MNMLFAIQVGPEDIPPIPGLSYLPGFVTENDEMTLAAAIDAETWDTSWERRRQSYGRSYGKRAEPERSIPAWGTALAHSIENRQLTERPFDQILVNEYLPGQ